MSDIIDTWRKDHVNFSRLLNLLEVQIKLFHEDETPDYELMQDIIYYMTHYPDLFHHPKEDLVFDMVKKVDSSTRSVVDELMEQHVVLRESGMKLFGNLEAVVAGAMLTRASVEQPAETYITYFRSHMKKEESEIFSLAEKLLSDEDWRAVDAAVPPPVDPLFGPSVNERYVALHRQIADEVGCGCGE